MSHFNTNFGIVTERNLNRISFFNTDTQTATHQIPVGVDAIDVDITKDAFAAVVTAATAKALVQLDLLQEPPAIVNTETLSNSTMGGVGTSTFSTGSFAVTVQAAVPQNEAISYSLSSQSIVSTLPAALTVAYPSDPITPSDPIAPVVALDTSASLVRLFLIDNAGNISASLVSPIASGGAGPEYVTATSDHLYALVSNFTGNSVSVVQISDSYGFTLALADIKPTSASPMGIAITANNQLVFVLTATTVDRFAFNTATGVLTPLGSFLHGLTIPHYPGVTQIALDPPETKLFISGSSAGRAAGDLLAVFSLLGVPLGVVPGIFANGGIDTATLRIPTRGISWLDADLNK